MKNFIAISEKFFLSLVVNVDAARLKCKCKLQFYEFLHEQNRIFDHRLRNASLTFKADKKIIQTIFFRKLHSKISKNMKIHLRLIIILMHNIIVLLTSLNFL